MSLKCVSCLSGRKWECTKLGNCDDASEADVLNPFDSGSDGVHGISVQAGQEEADSRGEGVREDETGEQSSKPVLGPVREINTYKDDSALRDQQSTGRKRAAEMYPLDREADCEWTRKRNVGGNIPIVGCLDGKQQARHHGPDKNTLNNEYGNVHRICHNCHNRWHTVNDSEYVWGSVYPQHSPSEATFQELVDNMAHWSGKKLKKVVD